MLVMGIDPGIAITGIGLVKETPGGDPQLVHYCVIDSTAVKDTSSRLLFLHQELEQLLAVHQPDEVAIEKLFFQKNAKTAMAVSEARGVIRLCVSQHGLPLTEYTPNEVKQAVTSYGNADKKQVQEMIKVALVLDKVPKPDDAADALAVALCHLASSGYRRLLENADADY